MSAGTRLLAAGLLVAGLVAVLPTTATQAAAQTSEHDGDVEARGRRLIGNLIARRGLAAADVARVASGTRSRDGQLVTFPTVKRYDTSRLPPGSDADNDGWCRSVGWEWFDGTTDQAHAFVARRVQAYDLLFDEAVGQFAGLDRNFPCPADDVEPFPPDMAEDLVRQIAEDVLPAPEILVPPGHGLAGLPAYLVTGRDLDYRSQPHVVDLGIVTATVTFTGSGTATVDWGDPRRPGPQGPYSVAGRAWSPVPDPDQQISHTYVDRGTYTISVQDTWEVAFDLGGIVGRLTVVTDPVVDDFRVHEYAALRGVP